jgi:anti-sigma B factor antagonist
VADMREHHAIVNIPAEIDISNAAEVAIRLRRACRAARVVVADMTLTTFCDSRGMQEILLAHQHAKEQGGELRVVAPAENVLRVWQLAGADAFLLIYPDIPAALGTEDTDTKPAETVSRPAAD